MARFELQLPDEIIKDIQKLDNNSNEMFKQMTKAGAEVALNNVKANLPQSLKDSNFSNKIFLSKSYETPSDDGVNTKVMISGYFKNKKGETVPAPLVANMFEYGSSKRDYPKQPFFRKSFGKAQIEAAMLKKQKELSGGLLDE